MNITKNSTAQANRLIWIDIYKALAIILVVVGHATGKYTTFIYQFHVAAFFFISGWLSKQDKESLGKDIYKKLIALVMPLSFAVLVSGIYILVLKKSGLYYLFYESGQSDNIWDIYRNFFTSGATIDLLGATWFVEVLFWTAIFSHLLYNLSRKKLSGFAVMTLVVYIFGCWYIAIAQNRDFGMDIALVAQGYYGFGFIMKKMSAQYLDQKIDRIPFITFIGLIVICSLFMVLMNKYLGTKHIMNLANRSIKSIWWSSVAVVNGIIWMYSLSHMLGRIKFAYIQTFFGIIGKNTMGIMFLHFAGFKFVYYILYKCGITGISTFRQLVPTTAIGNRYWLLFVIVSTAFSILIWQAQERLPGVSSILGMDKKLSTAIAQSNIYGQYSEVYHSIQRAIVTGYKDFKDMLFGKKCGKKKVLISIAIFCMVGGMALCAFAPSVSDEVLYKKRVVNGPIQITFPYKGNSIEFGSGWLEQGTVENYRWVRMQSEFKAFLGDQNTIILSGYVPPNVIELSELKVYLNDELLGEYPLYADSGFNISAGIDGYKGKTKNVFKFVFDAEYKPSDQEADQRIFSAMFTSISFE